MSAARLKADLVIVLLHSGWENRTLHSSPDQRMEAHTAIDAGAALVIGVTLRICCNPSRRYHGGLIAYSLGNFVFDDYKGISNADHHPARGL